ncbi:MAG: protein translocase subunit SecD [Lachnospiraceae bacterium]|jgi:SecD/SecF fusion protein|nr:protein translocase subunit SecD [Lachnospiraceae bacterium]MCI9109544.1 protein translocase subunit SecD [Lachnospiraceae bacterium]MCI9343782.1 protein translocase subunit SecD [Lachnospiraceae bacterium]GFH89941.1 protein translocase subunit SecDF [Lachnospiraceae bacterium]GFI57609.1 protein translocase subunit SecDF [Muribaculaceae bacterium]
MKKNKAIIILLVMVLALCGLSYTAVEGIGTEKAGAASGIKLGLDLAGGVSITYQVVGEEEPSKEDMADTIYKLQRRVEAYSTEAQVYKEGNDRINIEIPGVSDANAILEELGKPGSLFFLSEKGAEGELNYTMSMDENGGVVYVMLRDIEELQEDGSILLAGTDVQDAQAGSMSDDMQNSQFVVGLTMTPEGTKKFADATSKAYQNGETIAIYYDDKIISAPQVNAVISDGNAQITGSFTYEEADKLASTIRIGGLKLELEELRSNVVGAQLGSAAINTSLKAAAVGFGLVVIFMIFIYWVMGAAASLALGIYTALIVVMLNLFEITLTLPGIAGIILSIGMAVDANVIIFARIREELATGKTVQSAIKIGFSKAFSAILDGNVTTLIAAVVLGFMGSGSVKGFAQTLALGIILSMFTALVITKQLLKAFYAVGLKKESLYGVGKESKRISFLSKKNIFFAVSVVVIVAGFVVMGINQGTKGSALNYSLEFVGGTSTNVTFNEDRTIEDIDSSIVPLIEAITGDGNVQTQKVAGTNEVIFKTRTLTVEEREQFKDAMVENFSVDAEKITAETISSTISSEMQSDAVLAILIATACMLIYIWFRFKDIRFGTSAVLALVHDVLVVLAFYAAARVSVGSTFIACMLTIVGYSINATIVIFDRIRENLAMLGKKGDLQEMVNRSISQTLSRSIFTSLTTFFMVVSLFIFGVSSIREFALPLMVGIICGTYSSVCITGALWYVFRTKVVKKEK